MVCVVRCVFICTLNTNRKKSSLHDDDGHSLLYALPYNIHLYTHKSICVSSPCLLTGWRARVLYKCGSIVKNRINLVCVCVFARDKGERMSKKNENVWRVPPPRIHFYVCHQLICKFFLSAFHLRSHTHTHFPSRRRRVVE